MLKKLSLLFSIVLVVSLGCGIESDQVVQNIETNQASVEHVAVEFTNANFESEVLKSSQVVLVDCWADW